MGSAFLKIIKKNFVNFFEPVRSVRRPSGILTTSPKPNCVISLIMLQQTYSRSVNILKALGSQHGNQLIELYRPGLLTPWDRSTTKRYYGFLTDLRAKIDINSLAEAQIPDLDLTTSRVERMTSIRDVEWKSPRMQLDFLFKTSTSPLAEIAQVSLLNRQPYYQVNLMGYLTDNGIFAIGNDASLYVRIRNVGYGTLYQNDSVTVFGAVKEECSVIPDAPVEISHSDSYRWIVTDENSLLLPANPQRKHLVLINKGSEPIYINYGLVATAEHGITLMPSGGSYEINTTNLYKGALSAISEDSGSILTGIESV
jgi:hypothetical protein